MGYGQNYKTIHLEEKFGHDNFSLSLFLCLFIYYFLLRMFFRELAPFWASILASRPLWFQISLKDLGILGGNSSVEQNLL